MEGRSDVDLCGKRSTMCHDTTASASFNAEMVLPTKEECKDRLPSGCGRKQ